MNIFGYEIKVTITAINKNPENKVRKIIDQEMGFKNRQDIVNHYKIGAIKILRHPKVSIILINAGLVPTEHIREYDKPLEHSVSLTFAKNWIETVYLEK